MNADSILTAAIALCCVLAIGTASTTLDSTVSTDPEEVLEVEYERIPIATGQAKKLDKAIDGEQTSPNAKSSDGDSRQGSGSKSSVSKFSEKGDPSEPKSVKDEQSKSKSSSGDGQSQNQNQKQKQDQSSKNKKSKSSPEPAKLSLLERLLNLLEDLFEALLNALPFALLVVALAVAVRYRDRLLSRFGADERTATTDGGEDLPPPSPENEVASAWFEMVERLDLADRRHLTPREYAEAASRKGVDADAARTLTDLFEEVRYGGANVTDERRQQAKEHIQRIRSQLEARA